MEKVTALVFSLAAACVIASGGDSELKANQQYRTIDSLRKEAYIKTPMLEKKNDTLLQFISN